MAKSIIIIGGGVAGLAAGCYARMNGFEADIYEMHTIAGGLCTAWKRKGYTFDGCIHWLTGSLPGSDMYRLWEEVGAVGGKTFFHYEYFTQAVDDKGNRLIVYTDPKRLREHLISISPGDAPLIRSITRDIGRLSRRSMPVEGGIINFFRMLPFIYMFIKYRKPIADLAGRFKNRIAGDLFNLALGWHDMSAGFVLWSIALMAGGDGGYPMGGSLPFARSMLERYRSLGGRVHFKSKVGKILTENDRAAGIVLADGSEKRADMIISAADGHATIFDMLDGKYLSGKVRNHYEHLDPFPPLVYVSLGVAGDYSSETHSLRCPAIKPFAIGPDTIGQLSIRIYNFDPSLAPRGKTSITVMIETNWEHWERLGGSPVKYKAEKERIGKAVVGNVVARFPAMKNRVEVTDVATPLTFVRYTGNWKGSYEGWILNRKSLGVMLPMTLPKLSDFYMIGQWISPGGGLPAGLITGRNVIRKICREMKVPFKSSKPKS